MDIEFSGCGCWNENKALFRAQTHVVPSCWEVTWAAQLNGTQSHTRSPHPCSAVVQQPEPCAVRPCSPKPRREGKGFLLCLHTHIHRVWMAPGSNLVIHTQHYAGPRSHLTEDLSNVPPDLHQNMQTRIKPSDTNSKQTTERCAGLQAHALHWVQQIQKSLVKLYRSQSLLLLLHFSALPHSLTYWCCLSCTPVSHSPD